MRGFCCASLILLRKSGSSTNTCGVQSTTRRLAVAHSAFRSTPEEELSFHVLGAATPIRKVVLTKKKKTTTTLSSTVFALHDHSSRRRLYSTATHDESNGSSINNNNNIDNDNATTMPKPPYTHEYSTPGQQLLPEFSLTELGEIIASDDQQKKAASDLDRRLRVAHTAAKDAVDMNLPMEVQNERMQAMERLFLEGEKNHAETTTSLIQDNRQSRLASLSYRVEDYARLSAFRHFLQTAELWPLPQKTSGTNDSSTVIPVTDEEYLGGACMGLAQDLSRYALGRATVRDVASVQAAKDLVAKLLDFLLTIDFRNGPLRRKYDGVKYALQSLERLLYELAVTDASSSSKTTDEEPAKKKTKSNIDDADSNKHAAELQALKKRMDHRDELREKLIKKCRDGQKAAKQAIFALHRDDVRRATTLTEQCEACIQELHPTVVEEPPLRSGSFCNMLEEYVEARLFAAWLEGPNGKASGKLLVPADFSAVIELSPDEYLGGLCDLTGEIGRYAVQRGTERDADSVRLCLHSNQRILSAIQSMPVFPSGIGKKMDTLRRSIEKLERILYELSLSEAAGGRPVQSEVEHNNDQNDNE